MAEKTGPDDSEPTPERQAELQAAYDKNMAAGRAPYEDVHIRTQSELQWVLRVRGWSGDYPLPESREPADLRWADLRDANLSGVSLYQADLHGADLRRTDLSHACLRRTTLSRARLGLSEREPDTTGPEPATSGANLRGPHLEFATMSHAHLHHVNLCGAHLERADLSDARLWGAQLQAASLNYARMDVDTKLDGIHLDAKTRLGDVLWNGVPLWGVNWRQVPRLGDELAIGEATTREERFQATLGTARAYRQLATVLRAQGLGDNPNRFAYLGEVFERKVDWQQRAVGKWAFSLFLWAIAGYGYRLSRIVAAYVLTLAAFAVAFYIAGLFSVPHLTPHEAAIVSFTAIHGRVFLGQFGLDSTLSLIAGIEAVFGIVIEGVFVAMLIQRFFGR
jgi:uncharacterized protein YjbI with pentapeptide repeats